LAQQYAGLLSELTSLVTEESKAAYGKLNEIWSRPQKEKIISGWTQEFSELIPAEDRADGIWAYLGEGESRFREGDLLCLHDGDPFSPLGRQLSFELEEEDRWLLACRDRKALFDRYEGGPCFADPDSMDLTDWYLAAIEEIGKTDAGRNIVLPLLSGELNITFRDDECEFAEKLALGHGLNAKQAEAAGSIYGAEQVACVQGPPGTGKTALLAWVTKMMVERGERILVTSHTHMAINNALNKIHKTGVPTVKVGRKTQGKGLDRSVPRCEGLADWPDLPTGQGYVVGATPFATCSSRLQEFDFDVVIFDEASQVTAPLALMAMRKGRRFVFIGDHKQLPPVLLSRSILSGPPPSIFDRLTSSEGEGHSVMLEETYRMNRWLTEWPSRTFYDGDLRAAGPNRERQFHLSNPSPKFIEVLGSDASAIFIPTLDRTARTRNQRDARLVADICAAAAAGGQDLNEVGIVCPYRAQGRLVREVLAERFDWKTARSIIADTVERMQGQEREMVILSLATGDEVFLANVAEFFFQPQRLNVSITRAKTKLIIIGPETRSLGRSGNADINRWISWYRDMIGRCKRVDVGQ
jgi:DNA replication ATP-dependent helicase Dna2